MKLKVMLDKGSHTFSVFAVSRQTYSVEVGLCIVANKCLYRIGPTVFVGCARRTGGKIFGSMEFFSGLAICVYVRQLDFHADTVGKRFTKCSQNAVERHISFIADTALDKYSIA